MKIVCYAHAAHQREAAERFAAGLSRHGIEAIHREPQNREDCDLAVVWGHRYYGIQSAQRAKGLHYLVMERGYIGDRFKWTSLGFDGLNGRAQFPQIDDGMARWNKHFACYMKPWRTEAKTSMAVIMGQARGDNSVKDVNLVEWITNIAESLGQTRYFPVLRPHPDDPKLEVKGVRKLEGSLEEALNQAALVVTYNSNSGVDAVLAGVPTYAADPGSMVFDLSSKNFEPNTPDRTAWCKKMAYTQWLPEEIESGEAWKALRTVIDDY
jgi:hypothetical protein